MQSILSAVYLAAVLFLTGLSVVHSRHLHPRLIKPYLSRPSQSNYTVLVSVDGAGFRAVISLTVLVEFEDAIKQQILDQLHDSHPKRTRHLTLDDIHISLADFVDCFAGTSSGSWIATYLASKGGNGRAAGILQNRNVIEEFGNVPVESPRALIAIINIFARQSTPQQAMPVDNTNPAPGVLTPRSSTNTLLPFFNTLYGNMTISEFSTSCFVTSYDLIRRSGVLFVNDQLSSTKRVGYTQSVYRNKPISRNDAFMADIQGHYNLDFLLRDIVVGSSSLVVYNPAQETISTTEPRIRMLLADGYLYFANPTIPAISQIVNSTGDTDLSNIAVLSIGGALAQSDLREGAVGGREQWINSSVITQYASNSYLESLNKQMKLLFQANTQAKPHRYLRIQPVPPVGSERNELLQLSVLPSRIPAYAEWGQEVAENYRSSIKQFVHDFIF